MRIVARIRGGFRWIVTRWRRARPADVALGKYIILTASLVHITWAYLLFVSPATQYATPIHIISQVAGGRYRAAAWLILVAIPAFAYPLVREFGRYGLPLMLIPQQVLLLMSAFAGIHAAIDQHYADGVIRGWAFILGDQMAIIAITALYTIAVIEAAWADRRVTL